MEFDLKFGEIAAVTGVSSVNGKVGDVELDATDVGAQDELVSGENIKTLNGQSILGAGDITVGGDVESVNGKKGAVVLDATDVGSGVTFSHMFDSYAYASMWLGEYPRVENWDMSSAENLDYMFANCLRSAVFTVANPGDFDLRNWDLRKVKNTQYMFQYFCYEKRNYTGERTATLWIDLSQSSSLTSVTYMFSYCSNGVIHAENANIATSSLSGMFQYVPGVVYLGTITSSVSITNTSSMFYGAADLTHIYCNNNFRDTASITSSSNMFYNCRKLPHYTSSATDKTRAYADPTYGYFTAM